MAATLSRLLSDSHRRLIYGIRQPLAYATIAREKGTDIGTISKLLGHPNPTITQNIYIHWRDEEVHQAAQRIKILQKSSKSGK